MGILGRLVAYAAAFTSLSSQPTVSDMQNRFEQENSPSRAVRGVSLLTRGSAIMAMLLLGWMASLHAQGTSQPSSQDDPSKLLLKAPETPMEMYRAATLMIDYGQPNLARQYLGQLVDANPTDEQLMEIHKQFGTASLLKVGNSRELQPEAGKFMDLINGALNRQAQNPQYLDGIIDQLFKSPGQRDTAIGQLRTLSLNAVPRMLQRYQETNSEQERDSTGYALVQMGHTIIPGMIAALQSPDPSVKSLSLNVLGWLNAQQARADIGYFMISTLEQPGVNKTAQLAWNRLDAYQAQSTISGQEKIDPALIGSYLLRRAEEDFCSNVVLPTGEDGKTMLWLWNDQARTIGTVSLVPQRAALQLAELNARRALAILPEAVEAQALLLAIEFAIESREQDYRGFDPTNETAHLGLISGVEVISKALSISLECQQFGASVVALDILRRIGSSSMLAPSGFSPVQKALNSPSPRVQMAAAETILQLKPRVAFPGHTRVMQILSQAVDSSTLESAMVIDPNVGRGQSAAGLLSQLGHTASLQKTGKMGFDEAVTRGDLSFIMIHASCIDWPLSATIANLKADSRTAYLPIIIYGPPSVEGNIKYLKDQFHGIYFLIETENSDDFRSQLTEIVNSFNLTPLTSVEKKKRQEMAIEWLHRLSMNPISIFDLSIAENAVESQLYSSDDQVKMLEILSQIGTANAQKTIAETVTLDMVDPAVRTTAAELLCQHIRVNGLLLDADQISALRDVYRTTDNAELRLWLSSFVGMLGPNRSLTGQRILQQLAP